MSQTITFEAIGTQWWIEIFDGLNNEELEATKGHLELLCSTFNESYSRFRPTSLVGELNRNQILTNPPDEFRTLLQYGKEFYLKSEGAFNLLSGHILESRGYDETYSFTPRSNLQEIPLCNPLTDLIITETEIRLLCGKVDLGGFGKGYLIDLLATELQKIDIKHFLINGGGDMYATSDRDGNPLTIYLEHPTKPGTYILETNLRNEGFAASSPFRRSWQVAGVTYNHIVSANENSPLASFVKAPTAVVADAFATVAMVLPETKLPSLATREHLAIARFDPETNQLWHTANFT